MAVAPSGEYQSSLYLYCHNTTVVILVYLCMQAPLDLSHKIAMPPKGSIKFQAPRGVHSMQRFEHKQLFPCKPGFLDKYIVISATELPYFVERRWKIFADSCLPVVMRMNAYTGMYSKNSRGFTSELSSSIIPPMELIKQIITDASPKSCDLEQAPTWLVVESVDELLLPMVSRIVTTSLHSSIVL